MMKHRAMFPKRRLYNKLNFLAKIIHYTMRFLALVVIVLAVEPIYEIHAFVQSDSMLFYCDPHTEEITDVSSVFYLNIGDYIMTVDGCQIVENISGIRGRLAYRLVVMGQERLTLHPHSKIIVLRNENFIEIDVLDLDRDDKIILQNGEFLEITSIKNRLFEVSYYIKTACPYVYVDGIPIQINPPFQSFYRK